MSCRRCASDNQGEFGAEMTVVHRELRDVAKAPVLVYAQILVCSDCGFAEFSVPEEELRLLAASEDVPCTDNKQDGSHL